MTLRIEFYNAIAKILTYPENTELDLVLTGEEEEAIRRLLDILGRSYYAPPCPEIVDAFYQNEIFKNLNLEAPTNHIDCPCVRSEKHINFHRCKHGYYGEGAVCQNETTT